MSKNYKTKLNPDVKSNLNETEQRDSEISAFVQNIFRATRENSPRLPMKPYSNTDGQRCSGRQQIRITKVLKKFSNARRRCPKKETLHAAIIRKIKKILRIAADGKKIPEIINTRSHLHLNLWNNIQELFINNHDFLVEMADTSEGPKSDGASKRKKNDKKPKFLSHNKDYCKSFFESEVVRKIFSIFVEIIFSEMNVLNLSKFFKFKCCETDEHSE